MKLEPRAIAMGHTCVILLLCLCTHVHTKRVLLLPLSFTSHARQLAVIGNDLIDHGHEVYMVFARSFPDIHRFEDGKMKLIIHETPEKDYFMMTKEEFEAFFLDMLRSMNVIKTWRKNLPVVDNFCRNQFLDEAHYTKLKELNFDLAIVDIFPVSRSLMVLPYNLGIPYIGLVTFQEPWLTRNPALPSFSPSNMHPEKYSPNMNFWERLNNMWIQLDWNAWPRVDYLEDGYLHRYIRDKPLVNTNDLVAKCMLVLKDEDPLLDYPRPLMPHEVTIGGLSTKPANHLPEDLETFMSTSPNGVILMTFGSTDMNLPPETIEEFINAFREIEYSIIWKYIETPEGLPSNVRVESWLPQNDLLGHPKTRMFITHCGNNGQMEALYHGVPMIGIPTFGDQMYNCGRLPYHGFGICLSLPHFNSNDLIDAVNEITSNDSYRVNIKKASGIFKDQPMTPKERAMYWVEHVMKYGGDHLHSHALDMPWYEYLMLDIAVFIFGVVFIFVATCILLVYLTIRAFCQTKRSRHKKRD